MRNRWPIKPILECVAQEKYATQIGPFGSALKVEDYRPTGVPLLRGVNVNRGKFHDNDFVFIDALKADGLSKYLAGPGDIILVHRGTLGKIGLIPTKPRHGSYLLGNSMLRIRCDASKLLPEFLYYYLSSTEGQHFIYSRAVQVGVPALPTPLRTLRELEVPVPSTDEQQQIVGTLCALDDKIELNRRMNATLEAMAQALFKEWFVDGAKEEWEKQPLEAHYEVGRGLSYTSASLSNGHGMPLHNLNTVEEGGGYKYRGVKWYTGEYKERHIVKPGDLVVTNVEQGFQYLLIGYGAFIPKRFGPKGLFSQDLCRMRPLASSYLSPTYLYHLLQTPNFHDLVVGYSNGTTVNHLAIDGLRKPVFQVPPKSLHDKFLTHVKPMLERMEQNQDENVTLASLRDTLLPKLMRGEVRVKQSETIHSDERA